MKIHSAPRTAPQAGYALLTTMVFTGVSLLLITSTLNWTASSFRVTERNNEYHRAVGAAEASVESVIARMDHDFQDREFNANNLTPYQLTTPRTYMPIGWPLQYQFSDTNGTINQTTVAAGAQIITNNANPHLPGLYGMVIPCRVASCARRMNTVAYNVAAGVQQDFQLVGIPIFQFEAFYSLDLEINPGPAMQITGKVHGNADMYLAPQAGLEFVDAVETVGKVHYNRMADDPNAGNKVMPVFDVKDSPLEGANSLTLPIGTNNIPSEVVKVLDVPPLGEDPSSPLGSSRLYNQVDLIFTISPFGVVTLNPGLWDAGDTHMPPGDVTNGVYSFITTTNTFRDQREGKDVQVTDFDVNAFYKWMTNTIVTNSGVALNNKRILSSPTANNLNSVYINDQRSTAGKLTAVRVVKGTTLPPSGLTIATARPLYVMGNYNAPNPGSSNTANTRPAALMGDSITVLSSAWVDANSWSANCSPRPASTAGDTVNAAFLAGIVQTTNVNNTKHYSGGLENFPRFLEDWSGKTFTYNGSMVVMFPSRYATGWWVGPSSTTYYQAPSRNWAFDKNFMVLAKLPPCTPWARNINRGQWTTIAAAQ